MTVAQRRSEILKKRLTSLEAVSREAESIFNGLENELEQNIREYEHVSENVDVAADMALILVNLGKIVKTGMQATSLHGKALEEVNKELGKESIKFSVEPAADVVAKQWAAKIGANDGLLWALGKTTVQAWFDLTSPSFWAGVYTNMRDGKSWQQAVTESPGDAMKQALGRVRNQKRHTLSNLQAKIMETRLEMAGQTPSTPLVMRGLR